MTTAVLQPKSGVLRGRLGATRFAWAVVGWNILVALWGAVVRATQSGAGCGKNWPLCNGQVVPVSPTWHTVIEFVHRQSVTVSVLSLIVMVTWDLARDPYEAPRPASSPSPPPSCCSTKPSSARCSCCSATSPTTARSAESSCCRST